jgi:chromosome segregation ATPase
MDRLVPLVLLIFGLGAAYLGIRGLLRSGNASPEFWLFGLGVRTKFGAIKVLFVAAALCLLAYSIFRRGTVDRILDLDEPASKGQLELKASQLEEANKRMEDYKSQVASLLREKESCQEIVSKQGLGLASRDDVAAELRASLNMRQREIANLQATLTRTQGQLETLRSEQAQITQSSERANEKMRQLESQIDVLQNEKVSLTAKLDDSKLGEGERRRLTEENAKLKTLSKDQDRRAQLLRQGLVSREANDWALEQEIQRLANLLSDQPEVNMPRQTDIAHSLQKINQMLREGQALTKQAKIADRKPSDPNQDQTIRVPQSKK